MATPYFYGQDILQDALFRAGEPTDLSGDASDYLAAAKRYVWRAYVDFLKVYPWTFALKDPPLPLSTVAKVTGTATCTEGVKNVTLGATIADTMVGRKFMIDSQSVPYRITVHAAGSDLLYLDATYKESDVTSGAFTIFQDEYDLSGYSPLRLWRAWHRNNPAKVYTIMDNHNISRLYPNRVVSTTVGPRKMAVIGNMKIRIYPWAEEAETIEIDYVEVPDQLTFDGTTTDTPTLPEEDRHILADMALYYLFVDKNEPRAQAILRDVQVTLANIINAREPVKFRMTPPRRGAL